MTIQEYGELLAGHISTGDWENIEKEIHVINLPAGWQQMIKPMFDDLQGRQLSVRKYKNIRGRYPLSLSACGCVPVTRSKDDVFLPRQGVLLNSRSRWA